MMIGILWGMPLPFYIITGIADLFIAQRSRRETSKQVGVSEKAGVDKNCA
jgi:hypothetical protein